MIVVYDGHENRDKKVDGRCSVDALSEALRAI